jgi:hypothetical protein
LSFLLGILIREVPWLITEEELFLFILSIIAASLGFVLLLPHPLPFLFPSGFST